MDLDSLEDMVLSAGWLRMGLLYASAKLQETLFSFSFLLGMKN
jgi:hypothetical protein